MARLIASPAADRPAMPAAPTIESKDEAGITLTIQSLAANSPKLPFSDTRVARLFALYVPAGTSATPFIEPGPFRATFEGDLNMRLRDFYSIFAEGRGKLTLSINGQPVLEAAGDDLSTVKKQNVQLNKGKNHVVAIYESTTGDAAFRLLWVPKDMIAEPIPPAMLTHNQADPALAQGQSVRDGRFLIAQLRCTACHPANTIVGSATTTAMPELSQDAPSLKDTGARLNANWLAAWINNPRAMRARVHMPRVFRGTGDANAIDPRAADVAAYLATLGTNSDTAKDSSPEMIEAGGRTFTNLNCVACHISPDRTGDQQPGADEGRISLAHVKAKFKPGALTAFLLKPSAHYTWIPMPDFRLSAEEAQGLVAYLNSTSKVELAVARSGNAENGRTLFASSGCANCHSVDEKPIAVKPSLAAALDAIPAGDWMKGCLASRDADRKSAPDFGLTDDQRGAILSFAATDLTSLKRDSAPEFAQRQMLAMRCAACHGRDGKDSLIATVLDTENQELKNKYPPIEQVGNEGIAPDQRAPILTWAGEKLLPGWMQSFIAGQISYKPRNYLSARMPGFAARAAGLATGITLEHGCAPSYPPYPAANPQLAAIGQKLAGTTPNESFSCVRCHAVASQPPSAPYEAPAPNFMYVTERLRVEYYRRWMHNPLRVDPETKMPQFYSGDGKTMIGAVLDGDAAKQFDALWNYMLMGKEIQAAP
ncbi:MAG TPA: cytochrome c [Humisphaera sp.]|nr:cytochrome c [Humisphaera sp.]